MKRNRLLAVLMAVAGTLAIARIWWLWPLGIDRFIDGGVPGAKQQPDTDAIDRFIGSDVDG